MSDTAQVNEALLALAEEYANAGVGPAEFRRRRRELICQWTGQPVPEMAVESEERTEPGLQAIVIDEVAMSTTRVEGVGRPAPGQRIVIISLLLLAAMGAAGILWFVLR
jgi:hypothetical protein